MTKLQQVERDVQQLSADELADFRKWFQTYDSVLWDEQLQRDAKQGRLDKLRDETVTEHAEGRTRAI